MGFGDSAITVQKVLLDGVLVTGAGAGQPRKPGRVTYQAGVSGTGAVAATINVEGTNGLGWDVIGTITLSGTTSASDSFASEDRYASVRGNVTGITGTGAAASLIASA